MGIIQGTTRDQAGNTVAGTTVAVYHVGTVSLAPLYGEEALATPVANPVDVDDNGDFFVAVADGNYTVVLSRPGFPSKTVASYPAFNPDNYLKLAGRSGGQTVVFATGAGEGGNFQSTSHGTKGKIAFGQAGTTAYDEATNRWGFGTASPLTRAHVHLGASSTPAGELGSLLVTGSSTAKRVSIGYDDATNTGWIDVVENGVAPRMLYLNRGPVKLSSNLMFTEQSGTPAAPAAGSELNQYVRNDKWIVQWNDGGTVRYRYMDLVGTNNVWVHTTTAP